MGSGAAWWLDLVWYLGATVWPAVLIGMAMAVHRTVRGLATGALSVLLMSISAALLGGTPPEARWAIFVGALGAGTGGVLLAAAAFRRLRDDDGPAEATRGLGKQGAWGWIVWCAAIGLAGTMLLMVWYWADGLAGTMLLMGWYWADGNDVPRAGVGLLALGAAQWAAAALAIEALHRSRLAFEAESSIDTTSGLLNRAGFARRSAVELERSRRSGLPLGCLVVDIDRLKQINDSFGHAGGDAAIGFVGACIRQCVRPYDVAGRLGGDEFAVILPGADEDAARRVALRIEAEVREMPTSAVRCSVSIGVHAGDESSIDALLHKADDAAYVTKRSGGRGVTLFSELGQAKAAISG